MYSKAELKKYSEMVASIKALTRVYEEAAARKVRMVQILTNRLDEFVAATADTYNNVKFSLMAENQAKNSKANILTQSFRENNHKTLMVLITSQSNYYGNLIPNLYRKWKEDLIKYPAAEGLVFGNTGKRLYEKDKAVLRNTVTCIPLSDTEPEIPVVNQAAQLMIGYEHVICHYGAYKSVLTQVPEKMEITNTISVGQVQKVKRYLFESPPEKILGSLEANVILGLLWSKIFQSQVTKYAARIKILEIGQVAEKMSEVLGELSTRQRRVHKYMNNKKQLQLYTGSDLWQEVN
jgi:F0F1-type ATP synthase gamma subunit